MVVIFPLNTGVCLAIVFDDVIRCLETFWELCITHVPSTHIQPWSLRTEVASLPVIRSTAAQVPHTMLGLGVLVPTPPQQA
jgi:hypothetical protein